MGRGGFAPVAILAAAAILLAVLTIGYALGNILPFSLSMFSGQGIKGNAKLEVKLVMDNLSPLSNIEVDLGEKTGPPPKGGVAVTNENGVATFDIKPGSYVIYFNLGTFPKNLDWPQGGPETKVQVEENKVNEKTLILKAKQ